MKNRFADENTDELYQELFDEGVSFETVQDWLSDYYLSYIANVRWDKRMHELVGKEWSEEKERIYKTEIEKFQEIYLRLPTQQEDQEIWEKVLRFNKEELPHEH